MAPQTAKGRHAALAAFETEIASESAVWRQDEWDDMRVGYETYLQDFDDAPLLKGLPEDRCQCPHGGYVLAGKLTERYADHEDVVSAGEAYYMAPDHTMAAAAGTVLIEFSPREAFLELTAIAEKNFSTDSGEVDDAGRRYRSRRSRLMPTRWRFLARPRLQSLEEGGAAGICGWEGPPFCFSWINQSIISPGSASLGPSGTVARGAAKP